MSEQMPTGKQIVQAVANDQKTIADMSFRIAKLEEELEHAIKQYEHWEKEIAEQDKELNQIEALLIRLRNFVVKAEGHWLYGERWTDWIDKHLPKEKLIE
jgi:septal ring factor EnvC (AmiA/AmiB activator)